MSIAIRVLADWTYWLDGNGDNQRILNKDLVLTESDEVAAAAIAADKAEPMQELSDQQLALVEIFRLYHAGYSHDEIEAMIAAQEAAESSPSPLEGEVEGEGDGPLPTVPVESPSPPPPQASDKPRRARARA